MHDIDYLGAKKSEMASLEYVPRPLGRPRQYAPEEAKARNACARAIWRKCNKEHLRLYDRYRRTLPGAAARKALIDHASYVRRKSRAVARCVQGIVRSEKNVSLEEILQ